jgi:hypothetical protein
MPLLADHRNDLDAKVSLATPLLTRDHVKHGRISCQLDANDDDRKSILVMLS